MTLNTYLYYLNKVSKTLYIMNTLKMAVMALTRKNAGKLATDGFLQKTKNK
ncbi:hypothetical protein XT50_002239 [Salmonella enterica subsp. salamae]|nr:hypothetical protein [Salmonella enterica subsp. salamae]